ncbi:hypothetical protein Y590_18345 [Methylobacterium sp. AMS5]|nr:hypothetical protein Y590_18345 [Methylobacterium sp. AMS5]
MYDMYLDGRRTNGPRLDLSAAEYERLQADRIARQGQEIRCTRFFCDDIREELAAATRTVDLGVAA